MEYDEPGHPKEDRVAVNRVRQRYVVADGCVDARSGDSNAHSPRHERFSEGDVVVAYTEESDKVSLVEVEANLGLSTHRVSFLDGSGSTEVASHQLRYKIPWFCFWGLDVSRQRLYGSTLSTRRLKKPPYFYLDSLNRKNQHLHFSAHMSQGYTSRPWN